MKNFYPAFIVRTVLMKKSKILKFDTIMDILDALSGKGKAVRIDPLLKTATPKTVAERLRETIRLSEKLVWKRPSKS